MSNPQRGNNYTNIASATTTVVATGPGTLKKIVFNKITPSGVVTVYDNTAASGTLIATITNSASPFVIPVSAPYDINFKNGLTIVTSAADDLTVTWTQ